MSRPGFALAIGLSLIAVGFVVLAGWPAAAIVAGVLIVGLVLVGVIS